MAARRRDRKECGMGNSECGIQISFRIPNSPFRIKSTPTRSRTRTFSFEAKYDVHFTIGVERAEGKGIEPSFRGTRKPPFQGGPASRYPATFRSSGPTGS